MGIPLVLVLIVTVLALLILHRASVVAFVTHLPVACVGGVAALSLNSIPVSLSAAIGFIALAGIAIFNGVVMLSRMVELERETHDVDSWAKAAAAQRFRPVVTTALVAGLGFVPMMLATGIGAEIQRPLATVVVGGLVSSTALTLLVLPVLCPWFARLFATKCVSFVNDKPSRPSQ